MKRALYAGGLLGIFLLACEYEPEGIFQVDVPKPEPTQFSIDLDTPPDTIWLTHYKEVKFNLNLGGKSIRYLEIRFNGQNTSYYQNSSISGGIYLDGYSLSSGTYQLEFLIQTDTQSGSLADKLGTEVFNATIVIPVVVDKDPPPVEAAKISSIDDSEGSIQVIWSPYRRSNFYSYRLEANYGENNYFHTLTEIFDPEQVSFYDKSFLGGKVEYRLVVNVNAEYIISVTGEPTSYQSPEVLLNDLMLQDDTIILMQWSQVSHPANFESYVIGCLSCGGYYGYEEIAVITNPSETTYSVSNAPFGGEARYFLRVSSKPDEYGNIHNVFYQEKSINIGRQTYELYALQFKPLYQSFYASSGAHLIRIDGQSLEKEAQVPLNSYSGPYQIANYAISNNGSNIYFSRDNRIENLDPLTLQSKQVWQAANLFGPNTYITVKAVSDNQLLVLQKYNYSYGSYSPTDIIIMDMEKDEVITELPLTYDWYQTSISPDGRFLLIDRDIYLIESDTLNLRGYLPVDYGYNLTFNWVDAVSNQIWINDNNMLKLFDLEEMNVIRSFAVETPLQYATLDPENGYLSGVVDVDGRQIYRWYDPESGAKVKEIPVNYGSYYYSSQNKLWSSTGYYLPLNF